MKAGMKRKASLRNVSRKLSAAGSPSATTVMCWEDDPGDPSAQPALTPIPVPAPNPAASPLPFKIDGPALAPKPYPPGSEQFRYYAAAAALRRTADFWGGILKPVPHWQVGKVLPVELDSGVDLNAFYTRGGFGDTAGLHFFHQDVKGRTYFSGESPDVVCHEMGHAVLDALRPELWGAQTIEAAAFHESFGDMSALLSALQVASFRSQVLTETSGKLSRASRLSRLAEQLGAAIRVNHPDIVDSDCLRNAANSFFYTDPQSLPPSAPATQLSSEPHSFSRVFTGAFLEALAGVCSLQSKTPDVNDLATASEISARLLIGGVSASPVVPDYFSQVAAHIVQFGENAPFNGKYRDVLKSAFIRKGILSLQAATTLGGAKPRRLGMVAVQAEDLAKPPLPKASISASQYGLTKASLTVHTAGQPKRFAVTGASLTSGPEEPRSAQSAAEVYTEDIFKRGHVDVGEHAVPGSGVVHTFTFKTHVVVEKDGELSLERRTFDCGLGSHTRDR